MPKYIDSSMYDRAKELRDWTTWLATLCIIPALWIGKMWIDNHDMKMSQEISITYATKSEANKIEAGSIKRDEDAARKAEDTTAKVEDTQRRIIRIEQKIDDLKGGLTKNGTLDKQN